MNSGEVLSQIVKRMQVPGRPNLYVIGCFERRITFYTQQVRALNLVRALAGQRLKAKTRVAVVGAGAAGMTAAIAAALLECRVTIFERFPRPLDLIGPCKHRWLHPHIYDWPAKDSEHPDAGLDFLNWTQGKAYDVIDRMRMEWGQWTNALEIDVNSGVTEVGVHQLDGDRSLVTWNGELRSAEKPTSGDRLIWGNRPGRRMHSRAFDVVLFTPGFGLETSAEKYPGVIPYWTNDNFDEEDRFRRSPEPQKVLISGTGDGGLIDALRFSFTDFRHEAVLRQLRENWLSSEEYQRVCAEVEAIEQKAQALAAADQPYREFLTQRYNELSNSLTVQQRIVFRENVSVTLTGKHSLPFDLTSSPLSRFLVSLTNAQFIEGPLQSVQPDRDGCMVTFPNGRTERFDKVVVRHGPKSALRLSFPEVWEQCESLRKTAEKEPDPTRVPAYGDFYRQLLPEGRADGPSTKEIADAVATSRPSDEPSANAWAKYRQWALARWEATGDGLPPASTFVMPYIEVFDKPGDRFGAAAKGRQRSENGSEDDVVGGAVLRADMLTADGIHAVVTGPLGSGKTMLLRYLCHHRIQADSGFALYVPCRALSRSHAHWQNLPIVAFDAVFSAAADVFSARDRELLQRRFLAAVARGQAALYLDGLDELATDDQQRLWALSDTFRSSASPGTTLLLSTRAHVPGSDGFAFYRVLPWNRRQIAELIGNIAPDERAVGQLQRLISSSGGLDLARSPLLLIQLAEAAARNPGLFDVGVNWFVQALDNVSQDPNVVSAIRSALSSYAFQAMREGRCAKIKEAELIASVAERTGRDDVAQAAVVALGRSSLVSRADNGGFHFMHHSIEEYFAARGLGESPDPLRQIERFALQGFAEATFLPMAVALVPDVDEAFQRLQALPDGINFPMLRLRVRALRYASGLTEEYVERLGKEIADLIAAKDQCGPELPRSICADLARVDGQYSETVRRHLLPFLQDPDTKIRYRATWALGALKIDRVVEDVIAMIRDPELVVREVAAEVLGEIGGTVAVAELCRAYLQDAGPMVFRAAMKALVTIGDSEATEAIVSLVNDRSLVVNYRWPAIRALGSIGDPATFSTVMGTVNESASTVREAAVVALGHFRYPDATPALRGCLRDGEVSVRFAAANALGSLRAAEAVEDLRTALGDPHPMVSDAAARALERIGDEQLTEAIGHIVRDPAAPWCGGAATFLAELAGDSALPALLLLTRDPRTAVREGTATGLGIVGTPEAADALLGLCQDPSEDVRYVAVRQLGKLRYRPAVTAITHCLERDMANLVRSAAASALGEIGEPGVLDSLCRALSDPGTGQFAALALGHLRDVKAVPPLTTMCRSLRGEERLIQWPIHALGRIGGTAAADALAELFRQENVPGQSVIAEAMGDVAVPSVVGSLLAAGANESEIVRLAAREALRKLPHPIMVEGLAGALESTDRVARREAERLAPYYADERICRLLAELASREPGSDIAAASQQAEKVNKLRTSND